jgi:hypothetical protein
VKGVLRWAGYRLVERNLKRQFRRIEWVGTPDPPPRDRPLVIYSNHHLFYDSHALCLFVERVLGRPVAVWMEEYDRFPFFGALGAMPFPPTAPARRATTIRKTLRRMRHDPRLVLIYFPEGRLHAGADGVLPFDPDQFGRFDRIMPLKLWWPIAVALTGWHEARPIMRLCSGDPHATASGCEQGTLEHLLERLRSTAGESVRLLWGGRRGINERADFSAAGRLLGKGRNGVRSKE